MRQWCSIYDPKLILHFISLVSINASPHDERQPGWTCWTLQKLWSPDTWHGQSSHTSSWYVTSDTINMSYIQLWCWIYIAVACKYFALNVYLQYNISDVFVIIMMKNCSSEPNYASCYSGVHGKWSNVFIGQVKAGIREFWRRDVAWCGHGEVMRLESWNLL